MALESPPDPGSPSLAQEGDEHGRIGYGRLARFTPVALALALITILVWIGLDRRSAQPTGTGKLVGQPAPAFTLTTFDGNQVDLVALRGSVVVLNFWAEWCGPCKDEMPAFQRVHAESVTKGERVAIVGVDIKNDVADNAFDFAQGLGITYPIGQDVGGEDALYGPIQIAFGIDPNYPTTVFIRPDGIVDTVRIGDMTDEEIRERIAHAAG